MKAFKYLLTILAIIFCSNLVAQISEEQQKEIEEAQKKAMEMMKNNPQFQDAMKMMEGAEEQRKQERMQKQLEEEKRQKDAAKDHLKEFYWRNKVASDTQGNFSDWSWGDVELGYFDGKGKRGHSGNIPYESYTIIGTINSSGKASINLPSTSETNRVISNGLFPQMHEIMNDDITFSNPQTPFLWAGYTLDVLKNGKRIGILYMGNSERATHNIASPAEMRYGDEGYLLYWAYSEGTCKAMYSKDDPAISHNDGEVSKTIDQYTRVDLGFKPGWNLVKIEVNGNHLIGQRTRWKWKTYSIVETMPSDARYYFRYY